MMGILAKSRHLGLRKPIAGTKFALLRERFLTHRSADCVITRQKSYTYIAAIAQVGSIT